MKDEIKERAEKLLDRIKQQEHLFRTIRGDVPLTIYMNPDDVHLLIAYDRLCCSVMGNTDSWIAMGMDGIGSRLCPVGEFIITEGIVDVRG